MCELTPQHVVRVVGAAARAGGGGISLKIINKTPTGCI